MVRPPIFTIKLFFGALINQPEFVSENHQFGPPPKKTSVENIIKSVQKVIGAGVEHITPSIQLFIASFGGPGDLYASGGGFFCRSSGGFATTFATAEATL